MLRVLLLSLSLLPVLSARPPEQPNSFSEARKLYYTGSDGDQRASAEAAKLFAKLYKANKRSPRVQVYRGSLLLLEASHTWALWKKNSLSKEGLALMDQAVLAAPDDLEVRFVRAITTRALPSFFQRSAQSEADFNFLASRAHDRRLEPRLGAASLYYHGKFLSEQGKQQAAIAAWKQAITIAPHSRAARESLEALNDQAGG